MKDLLSFIFLAIVFLNMIFTRSFAGIYIFGYRIGELEVLFSLVICIGSFIYSIIQKNNNELSGFTKYLNLIIVSFILISIITRTDLLNSYAYKSSSYIWTVGFLFIGIFVADYLNKYNFIFSYFIVLCPLILYIFNSGNYPNFIIDFFKEYSDKFQFTKASDIFICVVSIYFYLEVIKVDKKFKLFYVFFYTPLYLPILIILSRGSYVGIILFVLLVFYFEREFIVNNKLIIFIFSLISVSLFVFSTFRISDVSFRPSNINSEVISQQVQSISEEKDTRKAFLSFYYQDGRLFSEDETTNWRLDIWQDVSEDLFQERRIFYGYGYKSVIPQMQDPSAPGRLGMDGLNEHVHNYFVTIFSRGGLFQLLLFIFLHTALIKIWKNKTFNMKILIFYLPIIFVSSLDISMDGVQFPLIFYSFLGYFLSASSNYHKTNLVKEY